MAPWKKLSGEFAIIFFPKEWLYKAKTEALKMPMSCLIVWVWWGNFLLQPVIWISAAGCSFIILGMWEQLQPKEELGRFWERRDGALDWRMLLVEAKQIRSKNASINNTPLLVSHMVWLLVFGMAWCGYQRVTFIQRANSIKCVQSVSQIPAWRTTQ